MSSFPNHLLKSAETLLADLNKAELKLAAAESCTGGLVSALFTEVPGCSHVFERGFVVYSNEAKRDMLGVAGDLIADHGAVSEQVAIAMAQGAIQNSRAHIVVSITGIAGPDGGTAVKPVGLVHFGACRKNGPTLHEEHRFGSIGREVIRMKSVEAALNLIRKLL